MTLPRQGNPKAQSFEKPEFNHYALQGHALFPLSLLRQFNRERSRLIKLSRHRLPEESAKYPLLVQAAISFIPLLERCDLILKDREQIDPCIQREFDLHLTVDDCLKFFCFAYLQTYGRKPHSDLSAWASANNQYSNFNNEDSLLVPKRSDIEAWLKDPDLLTWLELNWSVLSLAPEVQPLLDSLIELLCTKPGRDWSVSQTVYGREPVSFMMVVNTEIWQFSIVIGTTTGIDRIIFAPDWYKTLHVWQKLSTISSSGPVTAATSGS
jgi:hypothetical protein